MTRLDNDSTILVNTRNLSSPLTGVQRYTAELVARFANHLETVSPPARFSRGLPGHLWEQLLLPQLAGRKLLWSPANTGPLLVKNQVLSLHDLSAIEHPEWFTSPFAHWYGFLLPRLAHRVISITTMSEFTKSRVVDLWNIAPEKVVVIPGGTDRHFAPVNNSQAVSKTQGMPSEHYFLALGSLEPRKNLVRLLQAWDLVQASLPAEIWLVLAGAKGKVNIFKDAGLASIPPRVYLPGYVPDDVLAALYSGALAFIYPSLYEGFGLPPLEAMACGTPVITSNTTSLPEVVGDAALLVDPYDIEAIAQAIKQLAENNEMRTQLINRGFFRAGQLTWEKCAQQTWQVLMKFSKTEME